MTSRYIAEYKKMADVLPAPSLNWLSTLRSEAFDCFSKQGFPKTTEEEWRYTNFSALEKKSFAVPNSDAVVDETIINKARIDGALTLVIVDGKYAPELSSVKGLPAGITVSSMAEALTQQADLVERYLSKAVNNDEHSFIAFNTAWFTDGLFVHVPAKQILEQPIQLLHIVTKTDGLSTLRNIIALDEMAEANVIETFVGVDDNYLTASVTEVFLAKNAGLTLYKMQTEGDKAYHFGGTYIKQDRDSRLNHHNFAFGGLVARNDVHTDLGLASECELNGLYLGVKRQHIDNHTRINHLKPHGISKETYKGVLNQRARGVFQGMVYVAEDAQKTDSAMNNRNLLLSNDAEVDAKPQLEIYADDVKCAHGVTVGQLDEKSIFYLQSRCIDEETARNMLTFAFANEMVDKVKLPALKAMVLEQLLQRFPQAGVDKEWL